MWASLLWSVAIAAAYNDTYYHARYWLLADLLPHLPQEAIDELRARQEQKHQKILEAEREAALKQADDENVVLNGVLRRSNRSRSMQVVRPTLDADGTMPPKDLQMSAHGPYSVAELIRSIAPLIRDSADIVALKIVSMIAGKEQLFLSIKDDAVLLYNLNRNFDGLITGATEEVLPPEQIFGGGSCGGDVNLFCRLTGIDAAPDGAIAIDSHRAMHMTYNWFGDMNEAVFMNPLRRFGKLNEKVTGQDGLFYPSGITSYSPYNSTHITSDVKWTEVMLHGMDNFIFIADSANHRVMVLADKPDGLNYVTHFGTGEPDDSTRGLNMPVDVAIYKPSWEFRYQPIYANIFVADSRNNRIVKLDFGYPLSYDHDFVPDLVYDNETGNWTQPNTTYSFEFWKYLPNSRPKDHVELEYSGTFGDGVQGSPSDGRLTKPMGLCTYRHFIFIVEERHDYVDAQRIVVLTINHTRTSQFKYVTTLFPPQGIVLSGPISAGKPPSGALWFAFSRDFINKYVGVAQIPIELRLASVPSAYADWIAQCVDFVFYDSLVRWDSLGGREEWQKVMTENILRAGLHYWPYLVESTVNHGPHELEHNASNPIEIWDIDAFNGTLHNNATSWFDFKLFNEILFGGKMVFCDEEEETTTSVNNSTMDAQDAAAIPADTNKHGALSCTLLLVVLMGAQ